jgi:L-threonylcarbamoyladenylate synthase
LPVGTDITLALTLLRQGELVAIPTETVYGLAANAFDADAVTRIYHAKNRPSFNPLIIHTDSIEKLRKWDLILPEPLLKLAAKFSPGPITYVIPKSKRIPDIVTAGTEAVAVRIPNHPLVLELLQQLDFPLAAPSANPSGFISPTNAWHVKEQLGDKISYILNGGECKVGIESTIISFLHDTPEILRHGGISVEAIESVIGKVKDLPFEESIGINSEHAPVAPGMLAKHYAPKHKLIFGDVKKYLNYFDPTKTCIIAFSSVYENIPVKQQFVLSVNRNLDEAAQKLFAAMREADKMDVDVILAEKFPDEGLGRAINDRLKRAGTE